MVVVKNVFWQGPAQKHRFETYVGFLYCAGGLYTMFAILAVRRSAKEVMSRGVCGDLQKNCPGNLSVVPYSTSADEHLMGKFSSQFYRFVIDLKADFRLRWNLTGFWILR